MLTREALLAAGKPAVKTVAVPGLGEVGIARLSVGAQQQWAQRVGELGERGDLVMAALIVACVVEEDGRAAFGPDDVELILGLEGKAVAALFQAILEHNAMAPGALEEATKN